ncbi:T9SS type B sorting domain-containing protein [Robiginitalea biformata]|uniref:Fibronectin, type III n=1 Tax=Robiginitalea biformata (strain ATCC BAA-864 / DSM 15991 / KCTC 12146 / HTCC2501) TaxID=313596 RepID=A4CMP0_ROBBH|nr:T9SS type B sorting domain-containing protein [Robiginitalea biformata]EAR14932.1 Fibronectin, type III [Robiginitalea biformata HTCC2501]
MKMFQKLLCVAGLLCALATRGQECPQPVFPADGQTAVAVDASIQWTAVTGVTAYSLTIGTTPGGTEVLPLTSVGLATSYAPARGLPDNQEIFVTLYIFNLTQGTTPCTSFSFTTEDVTTAPGCTVLLSPTDGSRNVPVGTDIRWAYSPTATSYTISIGTSPGGSDLVDGATVDDALRFVPPADLPEEQDIYVRVVPQNENGEPTGCSESTFRTGPLATLPGCSVLRYPADGESNIPLSPVLEWDPVPGATGYIVSIGTSPTTNDVLDSADLRNVTETDVINFLPNTIYFVRIVPYNSAGEALGCGQTTFSTILGCGPYFDAGGNLVDLHPEITFPATVGICRDNPVNTVSAIDAADGYRWYLVEAPGRERLLAEGPDFEIPGEGTYRHEIYNTFTGVSGDFECSSSREFTVAVSEAAIPEDTDIRLGAGVIRIEANVSGIGDYEFSLGNADGPYQESNVFSDLPLDSYRIYVRDRNGCGITEILVEPDLTAEGFPNFFTPNGDGRNDRWQFILPESGISPVREISIFDRYGNLIARVDPQSDGWDGTLRGNPLPPSDYWYRAVDNQGGVVTGHFTLKR